MKFLATISNTNKFFENFNGFSFLKDSEWEFGNIKFKTFDWKILQIKENI